ncbi:transcription-repair coupling factor [Candidatus Peregrinibacteria bacterium CG_4_10_14_0_2_um_filter_43_11]|nr:MAG: transcription-repair coupling factor [Candidatus Peregrinibacteria bacterium CG_4_10_14_0_2_um_filter_43_11]
MNLYPYFPNGLHRDVFVGLTSGAPLVLSGVGSTAAKGFLLADLVNEKEVNNIFWLVNDNKDIYELRNNLSFWTDRPVVALDNLFSTLVDDYRITETITSIHDEKGRVYLINYKDVNLPLPTYQDITESGVVIESGQEIRPVEFFNQLIHMGYRLGTDVVLNRGEYRRSGGVINIFPPNYEQVVKIEVDFDEVSGMWLYGQENKHLGRKLKKVDFLPINLREGKGSFLSYFAENDLVILDDVNEEDENVDRKIEVNPAYKLIFTSFPKNEEEFFHLRYLSVLKYYDVLDLLNDLRSKLHEGWRVAILTKRTRELRAIFDEERIRYLLGEDMELLKKAKGTEVGKGEIIIVDATDLENVPNSFQNPQTKVQLLTDKEFFSLSRSSRSKVAQKINLDFLTGLRVGDLIVHLDHGIGRFLGVVSRVIDEIHREYLEIAYAENDRLFVPIDQADKISKYVGGEENEPQLTRLGSIEWKGVTQKIKKETQKIAKELLELYAKRAQAKGHNYGLDTDEQKAFEASFPYEETPGQMKAIQDVKHDMESDQPMDRLICGDVGFGKTEVAMRAAFKAAQSGKQVAFLSPITILADQHYRTFLKRAKGRSVRIEMLSRFRTPKEQIRILEEIRKGDVDIVIGTHRLFQEDVKFFNLGLVIIDEEQRFGVKQKEKFKSIRNQVDILTLTATPIPRTLNLSLNKLRDITTITTPPPGRLPIVTEVRRHSDNLILEAIRREVARGGQVYFLHNRVRTIESIAEKYRKLMPEVRFIVAHGQLSPTDLEQRVMQFKEKKADVLVSSTIIENGIDLPNANTLIVDNAENFGLSQMYQLRGRIGRSKVQAYAFFLYRARQLRLDAKKRLRAIVDASELGSGFQVAMRDLEIRGAGDVLGVNQHGTIRVVGVNHFLRMLNKTIEEMHAGRATTECNERIDVSIEIPLEAYIPDKYIPDTKDKVNVYQKLSSVDNMEILAEFQDDLIAEYGNFPKQVNNLFQILHVKMLAQAAGITNIKTIPTDHGGRQIILHMGATVTAEQIMNLLKHNSQWLISGENLKIDMKELGFNWVEGLRENMQRLAPIPKVEVETEEK